MVDYSKMLDIMVRRFKKKQLKVGDVCRVDLIYCGDDMNVVRVHYGE